MNRRTQTETEIEEMQPVAWRPDGTPTRFEIVQRPEAQPYVIGADDAPIVAPVVPDRLPRVQRVIEGSPVDEARGFNIRVSSLAAVLGGGAVLMALVFGASLSFWAGVMWFGTVFALTWAAAFALDAFTSAGGVELFHAARMWAFLDREQAHRHNRYSEPLPENVRLIRLIVGAAAVGATVLFLALIVAGVALENMPR